MVKEFEGRFAKYIGAKFGIAVSSGTAGLMVSMMALLSRPGQRVATTPLTFVSTANCALFAGGVPVFGDIDAGTLTLDTDSLSELLGTNPSVVVPVHLYGLPVDIKAIRSLNKGRHLVVEDAAQSLGAEYGGHKVGTMGHLGVFSFYSTKHIALGEGGMITTNDGALADTCRKIRSHGQDELYHHVLLGYNFRLPPVIAEKGILQLPKINQELEERRKVAGIYTEELRNANGIGLQRVPSNVLHSYYRFPIILEEEVRQQTDALARTISRQTGARLGTGYGRLIYQQPLYQNLKEKFWGAKYLATPDYRRWHCPTAERLVTRIIELPTTVFPEDARFIAASVRDAVAGEN